MTRRKLGTNVLIISDDLENGRAWAYSLSMRGFHVRVTSIGLVQDEHNDLDDQAIVIIDENHTANKLHEVCRTVRASFDGPVVVFTYAQDEPLLLQLYDCKVDECVCKPVGTSLFLAKVTAWVRRSDGKTESNPSRGESDRGIGSGRRLQKSPGDKGAMFSPAESRLWDTLLRNPRSVMPPECLFRQSPRKNDEKVNGSRHNLVFRPQHKDASMRGRTFSVRAASDKNSRFVRKH